AAVAAVGTAPRDELLAAKSDAAVPAVARGDVDFGFVEKQGLLSRRRASRRESPVRLYFSAGGMLTKRPRRPLSWKATMPATMAKSEWSLARPTFVPGFSGVPRCRTRIEPPVTN